MTETDTRKRRCAICSSTDQPAYFVMGQPVCSFDHLIRLTVQALKEREQSPDRA